MLHTESVFLRQGPDAIGVGNVMKKIVSKACGGKPKLGVGSLRVSHPLCETLYVPWLPCILIGDRIIVAQRQLDRVKISHLSKVTNLRVSQMVA